MESFRITIHVVHSNSKVLASSFYFCFLLSKSFPYRFPTNTKFIQVGFLQSFLFEFVGCPMSASTVSITANPVARRRPVVAGEKKTGVELVAAEPAPTGDGPDGKGATTLSRDVSHYSNRSEPSKDLLHGKKAPTSTVSPRRSRKSGTKSERPWWLTAVSIFSKNFLLLMVILGLFQIIRKSVVKSGDSTLIGAQLGLAELEGRIAEVEGLVKKTTKMMQVQVEVVDRKIDSEIQGSLKDLNRKFEEKTDAIENALKNLEDRSEDLDTSFKGLKNRLSLSEEEFKKMYEELRSQTGGDVNRLSLDDLNAYAREAVLKEIDKHAADGLAKVDYALASGGGSVIKHSEPYSKSKKPWGLGTNGVLTDANKMLTPSFGEPGHCFPLKGSSGFVQIKLRDAIIPEAVTLEHVAKSVAYDRSSAPKHCRVFGWLRGTDSDATAKPEETVLLTEFMYDLEKSNAQTFNVQDGSGAGTINTVYLEFTSNHGSNSHTCIYRFRVHGYEPKSVSMAARS